MTGRDEAVTPDSLEPAPDQERGAELRPGPADGSDSGEGIDQDELLAAFERRSPAGGLRWGFDDALRRIEDSDTAAGGAPWTGLPDDLWQRGRSAQIGQRLVGDVAGVMADILAADARAVADAMVGDRFKATWDAFRFLAARVDRLEGRIDPLGLETAEWPAPAPDPEEWSGVLPEWLGDRATSESEPVVVGESGDGSLVRVLRQAGWPVVAVDPRGEAVWPMLDPGGRPDDPGLEVVLSEVEGHLRSMPDRSAAATVLVGCTDRVDLAAKARLLAEALRVTRRPGTVVVLATDRTAWEETLTVTARDLAPGWPLHPDTWSFLLERSGTERTRWYRPAQGTLHAVVARVVR